MCGHQVQISAVFKQWRRINPEWSLSLWWPLCRLLFPVPAVTWDGHVTAHITSLSKGHCIKIRLFYATEPHPILPFRWGGSLNFFFNMSRMSWHRPPLIMLAFHMFHPSLIFSVLSQWPVCCQNSFFFPAHSRNSCIFFFCFKLKLL